MPATRSSLRAVAANQDPRIRVRASPGTSHARAKTSFLAAMSHELRTPLNAIIGFAQLIDAQVFGPISVPQYQSYIHDILTSARHLLQIIEDVLEITRGEAGELVLNKREIDVGSLVDQALVAVRPQSRSKRIRITADLPEDLVIKVDPDKMKRVVASLLSNAVKFSPDRSSVRVVVRLRDCDHVTISIEDHGIGMEPEAVERAFAMEVPRIRWLTNAFGATGPGLKPGGRDRREFFGRYRPAAAWPLLPPPEGRAPHPVSALFAGAGVRSRS